MLDLLIAPIIVVVVAVVRSHDKQASNVTAPGSQCFTCRRSSCNTDNGNCNSRQPQLPLFRAKLCKMKEIKPRKNKFGGDSGFEGSAKWVSHL